MVWSEMRKKYPGYQEGVDIEAETDTKYAVYREDMDTETERAFVADCFECYESEGFAKKFWSPFDHCMEYAGEPFEVLGRITEEETDLCVLPMWRIRFSNGTETDAYPEEIIPREMRDNGCKLEGIG